MCHTTDSLSPREQLAQKIRTRTNDGDDILDYLYGVFYDEEPGVLHGHRIQAGRVLVIYGQLSPEAIKRLQELESHSDSKVDRDQQKADSSLARKIRRMTGDGDDIITYLLDTMNGIDNASGKRVRHNNRLAAARELLKRGYPCECARHDAAQTETETAVMPTKPVLLETGSGIQEAGQPDASDSEPAPYDQEEQQNIKEVLEIIKKAAEEADPSEWEEEESDRQIDYSMWETIRKQPRPVITEEQARIGAAKVHEAIEKWRAWDESNVKIPAQKEYNNYDDG